jgi:hypothetical protein
MGNRRDFLKSIVPAAVVAAVPAPVMAHRPPDDECQFYADQLAEAMVRVHGGKAIITIDHRTSFAQVIVV